MSQQNNVIWFVGLSGAGKTTLSRELARHLRGLNVSPVLLDGDDVRRGLNADLGYTDADRTENIRRIAWVARLLSDSGLTVVVATISPLESHRALARSINPDMLEIFVQAPFALCEQRDPKGFYQRARKGLVANFTGISSTFEPPQAPDFICDTSNDTPEASTARIIQFLKQAGRVAI